MASRESPPSKAESDVRHLTSLELPGIPAVIDPDDPNGLVRAGTWENDLEVRVPVWPVLPEDGRTDELRLFWGTPAVEVDFLPVTGPVDPDVTEFWLKVPKDFLKIDGRYEVFYQVRSWSGFPDNSPSRAVTLDSQPPGAGLPLEALLLPVDLEHGLIDQAYLDSHGGIVELRLPLPLYAGAEGGDVLSLYWTQTLPPTNGVLKTKTITQAELNAQDVRVQLLASEIAAPGTDGVFHAVYTVRDLAGNESPYSRETVAAVVLGQGQGTYPEVAFPDADRNGYYLCEHKPWEGIRARVPLARGFDVDDRVILLWEGFESFNGVGPIAGTKGRFEDRVEAADLTAGFLDIRVQPYTPYIEAIVAGSAIARYVVIKATGLPGLSRPGLVKIDRRLPDGSRCGPARSQPQARETLWRRLRRVFE
ncbi:hypothetical protein EGT09_25260 [Pseudomonas putida]|uniref:hypothetical protein n=1 Tax=Pseudomonas putida TaxID=303 RepID=UPI000F77EA29|nr:hypothetical protein [Pseudomonas putida]RSC29560.1 hypothetical protein EGT09_25260 [Pseudomonas putida]